jgi:nucleotide-binding universal stress UspA family protein
MGEELDTDAIVVGARGLSRVQSALLGSVSSAVVAHAHRPVLVIPPVQAVERKQGPVKGADLAQPEL